MAFKKVPINSDCPSSPNKLHQWTTHETQHPVTKQRAVVTWCKACGSVPK